MPKAQQSDRKRVIEIIAEAFQNNPSVLAVIKNDRHKSFRLKALASYAFDTAIIRDGAYMSSDNQGVAICYSFKNKSESLKDYWNQIKLVFNAIGIFRVFEIIKRDGYIKKQRPSEHDFLYFWFFGATEIGKGGTAAKELKTTIFNEAETKGLPIYLETSVEKNKRVYQWYGFEVYHEWYQSNGDCLWFMKRVPQSLSRLN